MRPGDREGAFDVRVKTGFARWCEARPALVLGALGLACLVTFLATIPLPRADGQLLGADGFGYFVYLPSVVLDQDLDFTNQYAALMAPGQPYRNHRTPTGLAVNLWPFGPALLWLPFFLLAHVTALALTAVGVGIRLDGCGYWHQAFVIAGNIIYGGAALLLAFDVVGRAIKSRSALWAVVLVGFAGNLVYYLTAEPSMAHAVSAFAVSLFYSVWLRTRGRPGIGRAAVLGTLIGVMAAVRTQDVLLAVVPVAAELVSSLRVPRERAATGALVKTCRDLAVMALAALLVYSPQFVVSQALYGTWWKPPQLYAGRPGVPLFVWSSPHFWDVLFSAERGLLVWHPVYALALLGIVPLWRRNRTMAAAVLVGVLAQTLLLGSWFDWTQGQAFGGRTFIGCLPLFATALATLIDAARDALAPRSSVLRWIPAGVGAVLLVANFLLSVEYRFDLATRTTPTSWHDLGTRRVTFLLERLLR